MHELFSSQGTNVHGHTGLFPFSYTTYDQALALGNKAALESTSAAATAAGSGPGSGILPPSYSNATTASEASTSATGPGGITAEINNALTELQVNGSGAGSAAGSRGEPSMPGGMPMLSSTSMQNTARKNSIDSQTRSAGGAPDDTVSIGDGDTEEDGGAYGAGAGGEEDEYQSRSAARAALAANAKKTMAQADAQEKAEEERRRTSAMAKFEEEERRQRELLLMKERERKEAVESGKLDLSSAKERKSKAAPIAGVEMSDESDSEGSVGGFDDELQTGKTYSPLFQTTQRDSADQAKKNGRSSLGSGAFPTSDSNGTDTSLAAAAATAAAAAASLPAPSDSNMSGIGQRSLSPIPSSTHVISASNSQATSPKLDNHPVGTLNSLQRISSDISTRDRSLTADSFTGGAPTTTTGASETLGTGSGPGTATAPSSIAASRPAGDPYDWSIEQVCDWARSRGWDEANVVGKFAEHEITGDVLLELDVNMLKEIDITAFGTRHKVAVAIRDLKKATQEDKSSTPGLAGSALGAGSLRHASSFSQDRGSVSSPFSGQFPQGMGGQDEEPMLSPSGFSNRSSSGAPGVGVFSNRSSGGAAGIGLGAPPSAAAAGQRDFSNLTAPPGATAGFSPDPNQFNNGDREVMSDVRYRDLLGVCTHADPVLCFCHRTRPLGKALASSASSGATSSRAKTLPLASHSDLPGNVNQEALDAAQASVNPSLLVFGLVAGKMAAMPTLSQAPTGRSLVSCRKDWAILARRTSRARSLVRRGPRSTIPQVILRADHVPVRTATKLPVTTSLGVVGLHLPLLKCRRKDRSCPGFDRLTLRVG